jgi:hypothetical protein
MQPNTLTRRKYKGKMYVKIFEKIHVRSETIFEKVRPHPDPHHIKN